MRRWVVGVLVSLVASFGLVLPVLAQGTAGSATTTAPPDNFGRSK